MIKHLRAAFAAIGILAGVNCAAAGSVSGSATDASGKPVAGVRVEVVYETFRIEDVGYSVKAEAVTGPDGRYIIRTDGLPPGAYYAHAYEIIVNGGRDTNIDLIANDRRGFAPNTDTRRDFTTGIVEFSDELPYGNAGVFVVNNAIMDFTDLTGAEVTLEDVDSGRTFEKTVRRTGEGLAVTGIPFGTYRASVSLGGRSMLIALWGLGQPDEFGPTVVHDFTMGYAGNQFQVAVKPAQ